MKYSNHESIVEWVKYEVSGYVYKKGTSGFWQCPLCGYFSLDEPDDFDLCPICGMMNAQILINSECRLGQEMNFEEAKAAWARGEKVR